MANIKSAQKRIRVAAKRQARNKHIKSTTKTAIKKLTTAVGAGDADNTQAMLVQAYAAIDKAASKGVYHKNTAARKKSRLTKLVNKTVV
ncbi:MAG: 30S ribosomal protein S20 [Defluviitaleaceae bacterium]|nr:30S ribosomal protein S20 [Defluviitaleaceae bacterium]